MKEKIKTQKGFIQIPLLIIIIASIVVASAGTGVVLHKQGKLTPLIANISEVFKEAEETTILEEVVQPTEPLIEQIPEVSQKEITQQELEQARLEAEAAKARVEAERAKAEIERLRKEAEEARRKAEAEKARLEAEARIRAEQELQRQLEAQRLAEERQREVARQQELERQRQLEEQRRQEEERLVEEQKKQDEWITPVSVHASGYTVWGDTWYTGPPELAIDGNDITKWTLNDMGEITFDLGNTKTIKGIEAYWNGSVSNGNTVNVFVDDTQVLYNEKFGATRNIRYFDPIQGRYIKYQTVPLPHNVYLQVATWSEIVEFKVFVESE